jgi:F420-dependent oxidoreductase-like protein
MRAPVILDLHIANFTYPGVAADALFDRVVAMAQAAEDSGFSSVTVMDHVHQIPPLGPPDHEMLEGNTVLAALAARTSRVSLGLLVGGVTYRNPALLAKITTTLDVLSGGRAVLGLGAAWFEDEHRAYGVPFPPLRERFERLEDALRIARAMFTQERASVQGTHHSVDGALNVPRPLRGDIPILVGGSGERRTLRLVAQYADGCNVNGDPVRLRHLMGVLDRHCEDVGRDPREITRTRITTLCIGATDGEADRKLAGLRASGVPDEVLATAMVGGPERVAEQVAELRDAGAEGLTVTLPDMHDLDTVRLAGETLAPLLARG